MTAIDRDQSIVQLIATLVSDLTGLFQSEMRLVRGEITEKVSDLSGSVALIAVGGLTLFLAVLLLLFALVRWLVVAGIPDHWGYLIVGAVVAIVGGVVLAMGIQKIKTTTIVPARAIRQAREDLATVKEHLP